ncbi:Rhodanese-related sulfurtransferase [Geoglobus ahangari]|uniref:Rhodanese-related sulfurtransferase n=1 Tax=Geoglobus ahangari TaxID=113653 RepID=A0A0F7ICT2_9EURY|nr:rhodanese-like domain-containing protein [Geoglobus ahangari]AKG90678.1 Rhodanese-related sulfurtransferase [Geoglobus ahangari]NOY12099.1 rhodanese-like domain-containing protein [Archaeoglobi archaeon]
MRHAKLFLALMVVAAALLAGCSSQQSQVFKTISPDEAYKLIQENANNPDFVIIDIRTPQEYKAGHIPKAINIDYYSPTFKEELNKLDKSKTYLIYCRTGHRTGNTMPIMKELGFQKVYEIRGGITAWASKGYPVVK